MADWLAPESVAVRLDVPYPDEDGRVDAATAAVRAAVERRHSRLDFTDETTVPADIREGGMQWAVQLYQSRNSPSGYAGFSEESNLYDSLGSRRGEILKLLRWRQPEVA